MKKTLLQTILYGLLAFPVWGMTGGIQSENLQPGGGGTVTGLTNPLTETLEGGNFGVNTSSDVTAAGLKLTGSLSANGDVAIASTTASSMTITASTATLVIGKGSLEYNGVAVGGSGDAVLAGTQTWTGINTFDNSTTTISGSTFFRQADGATKIQNRLYSNNGFESTGTIRGGVVVIGNNTAYSSPNLQSVNDGNTGVHWDGGDSITIAANAVARFNVTQSTLTATGNLQIVSPAGYDRHILQVTTGTTRLFEVYGASIVCRIPLFQDKPMGADYVFTPEWQSKMLTIDQAENFTKSESHLPGFMGVDEFARTDSGTIMVKTIEKLEEAYLYIFQLEKRIKALEGR